MKKALLSLLALALVGTLAVAEDAPVLKFSGYVDAGVKLTKSPDDLTIANYASDFDDVGTWAYLTAVYGTANAGVKVRLRASVASDDSLIWNKAYAWVKPITGVTITAGKSYAGTFAGLDDNGEDFFNKDAVSVAYSIAGLTVGTGVSSSYAGGAADLFLFGAAYSLDKIVDLSANAQTDGVNAGLNQYAVTGALTAVDKLTLVAGYNGYSVNDTASEKYQVFADGVLGYALTDALAAQVTVYDYFKPTAYYEITPKVSYAFTPAVSAYAQVGVATGDAATYTPKAGASWAIDGATLSGYVAYNTDAKVTTSAIDLLYSF